MREEYDFTNAKRADQVPALARAQADNIGKERITIRLDADVLSWFRVQVEGGGNYQTLINDALRTHIEVRGPFLRMGGEVQPHELHGGVAANHAKHQSGAPCCSSQAWNISTDHSR